MNVYLRKENSAVLQSFPTGNYTVWFSTIFIGHCFRGVYVFKNPTTYGYIVPLLRSGYCIFPLTSFDNIIVTLSSSNMTTIIS